MVPPAAMVASPHWKSDALIVAVDGAAAPTGPTLAIANAAAMPAATAIPYRTSCCARRFTKPASSRP
jgi:hypothetical protein